MFAGSTFAGSTFAGLETAESVQSGSLLVARVGPARLPAPATLLVQPPKPTTALTASARPGRPLLVIPTPRPLLAPAAFCSRSTADPVASSGTPPSVLTLKSPIVAARPAVSFLIDQAPGDRPPTPSVISLDLPPLTYPIAPTARLGRLTADPSPDVLPPALDGALPGRWPLMAPAALVLQVRDLTALQASAQPAQPVIVRGIVLPPLVATARLWQAAVDLGATLPPAVVTAAARAAQLAPIRASLYGALVEDIAQPEPWITRAPAGPSSAAAAVLVRAAAPLEVPRPTATLSVLAGRWPVRPLLLVLVRPQGREFIPVAYGVLWPGQTTAATLAAGATGAPTLAGYPAGVASLSAGSTGAATTAVYPGGAPTLSGG